MKVYIITLNRLTKMCSHPSISLEVNNLGRRFLIQTASKIISVSWVWTGVHSHVQTCQNLSGCDFSWSRGYIVTLKNSSELRVN